jgi:hypothetical protein
VLSFCLPAMTATAAGEQEADIVTLWPLLDYRHCDAADYTSLNLLGPFLDYERKGNETEFALRPIYYRAADPVEGISHSEFLYPIGSRASKPSRSLFQAGAHLLSSDFGERERGSTNEFTLFPFIYYGQNETYGRYAALFPLGGKLYERFGRDEIRFALFPLYGQTRKKGTTITNVLWPVGARIRGDRESGLKLWPLFGYSEKEGVYRKRFWLWPVFFDYRLNLDSENPRSRQAVFPLYVAEDSPEYTSRTVLWPFFSHREDRRRDYEEWNMPWPLVRVANGSFRESLRLLPFYADERTGVKHTRWYLWPLYKLEETDTEMLLRRRHRVLYFLFSNLEETVLEEESPRLKRVALWPLFTYEQQRGIGHFYTFSLLEPFLPDNDGIEHSWAPLWRFYQRKWDKHGHEVSSLLWNLYWKERQGRNLALEVFPLFFYQRDGSGPTEFKLLKGLLRYRRNSEESRMQFFYLPWGVSWPAEPAPQQG